MKTEIEFPKNGFVDLATNLGHKFIGISTIAGKEYAWLEDPAGKAYVIGKPFDI